MAMNAIETVLSETADFLQQKLDGDPEARNQIRTITSQGGDPHVIRIINGMPGIQALIKVGTP